MVKFLVINKRGIIKMVNTTKSFELSNLYRKCGLKKDKYFQARGSWGWNGKHIVVFAANDGKAGQENKFELPPPLDTHLFFGGVALVCIDGDEISEDTMSDFTKKNWDQLYEKLLGGLEDLDDDSELDDEEEEVDLDNEQFTKEGYSKEDGFVVDSEGEELEDSTESSSGDEEDDSDSDYIPHDSDELSEDDYELGEISVDSGKSEERSGAISEERSEERSEGGSEEGSEEGSEGGSEKVKKNCKGDQQVMVDEEDQDNENVIISKNATVNKKVSTKGETANDNDVDNKNTVSDEKEEQQTAAE